MNSRHRTLVVFFSLSFCFVLSAFALSGCASRPKPKSDSEAAVTDSTVMHDPWFRAARTSDIAILKGMINGGQPVDKKTKIGTTALMVAAREGGIETVKFLIENGAKAAEVDKDGQSALVYALVGNAPQIKRTRIIEELLRSGANPFLIDKMGFQPVQEMISLDMDEQIKKLQFTDKKPCDLAPIPPGQISLSRGAREMKKPELAAFLEAQGCW